MYKTHSHLPSQRKKERKKSVSICLAVYSPGVINSIAGTRMKTNVFHFWYLDLRKKKSKKDLYMPESESASKVLHRVNPGADSQQRHQLLALITDSFLYLFSLLWQIQREACALVITAQVWKVPFSYWFVLMILGKSLNASAKLSAWDQDPSYTVKLQKQRRNVCEHLLRRVRCVYLGTISGWAFQSGKGCSNGVLSESAYQVWNWITAWAHIHRKKDFNQKSSYLSANTLLLGRQSSFQSVPGSSHTCPGLLLSTKINSTSKSQEMHMTGSTWYTEKGLETPKWLPNTC